MTDAERSTLQQRIAELEREVAYAKDSNLAMLEVHRQELTIRDKSRENAWRYNASLIAALKTAREAFLALKGDGCFCDFEGSELTDYPMDDHGESCKTAQAALQAIDKADGNG